MPRQMGGARTETRRLGRSRPSREEFRAAFVDAEVFHGIEPVFSDGRVRQRKKAMWGAPRSISTDARKGSNSAPFERLQPGERGFRESTAFYSLAEWLRGGVKPLARAAGWFGVTLR